jgi:hypothetical protein
MFGTCGALILPFRFLSGHSIFHHLVILCSIFIREPPTFGLNMSRVCHDVTQAQNTIRARSYLGVSIYHLYFRKTPGFGA